MITSWEIGAIFAIEDRATPVLGEIAAAFERLVTLEREVKEGLSNIGSGAPFANASTSATGFGETLARIGTMATAAADKMKLAAGEVAAAWTTAAAEAEAAWNRAFEAMSGRASAFRAESTGPAMAPGAAPGMGTGTALALGYGAGSSGGGAGGEAPLGGLPEPGRALAVSPARDFAMGERIPLAPLATGAASGAIASGGTGGGGHGIGMKEMAEALGAFEAWKLGMQGEAALARAVNELNTDGAHMSMAEPEGQEAYRRLRALAYRSHQEAPAFSLTENEALMPTIAREYGIKGIKAVEDLETIFPTVAKFSEVAKNEHLGGLEDTAQAGIEFAHLTGRQKASDLTPGLDHFLAAAKAAGADSMRQEERVMKYSITTGSALGANVDEVMAATAFLQRQGLGGTTAGTGLSALMLSFEHALKPTAQRAPARQAAEQSFASMLNLKPEEVHAMRASNRSEGARAAWLDMGLINKDGTSPFIHGTNFDLLGFTEQIARFKTQHPEQYQNDIGRLNTLAIRPMEKFAETPPAGFELPAMYKNIMGAPGVEAQQHELAMMPLQHWQTALAESSTLLAHLGEATLPALDRVVVSLTSGFSKINNLMEDHPKVAADVGYGLLGIAGLGAFQLARRAGGKALEWLGLRGAAGAAGEAAAGGGLAGTVAGAVPPVALGIGSGILAERGLTALFDWGADKLFGQGTAEQNRKVQQEMHDNLWARIGRTFGIGEARGGEMPRSSPAASNVPLPSAGAPMARGSQTAAEHAQQITNNVSKPVTVTVNLGGLTINGATDHPADTPSLVSRMMHGLADRIGHALATGMGPGSGVGQTAAVFGGT